MASAGPRGAVVITGASTGIGHASALHLASLGFDVFAGVRRDADAERLRAAGNGRIEPLHIDVTDEASIGAAVARVGEAARQFEETLGEYASGAVRRFANLADSEDWLGLMNVVERTDDPGTGCLVYMVNWSLKKDETPETPAHAGCTCGGGGCS